jgi:predicted DNA-binding helix-hairpin-helix protein
MPGAIGNRQPENVDLNTASEQELASVGGLGPERARRIVERRPIRSWDDLTNIEGFGERLVSDLRNARASAVQAWSGGDGASGSGDKQREYCDHIRRTT